MKTVKKMVFYRSFSDTAHSQKKSFKKGFSLIELVLAIVVVAITLAALPSIVAQTQKSNELAIKQELTYSAKTLMGRIISMPWDSTAFKTKCDEYYSKRCDPTDTENYLKKRDSISIPVYNGIDLNGTSKKRPGSLVAKNLYSVGNRIHDHTKEYNPSTSFKIDSYGFNPIGQNDIDDFDGEDFTSNASNPGNEDFISETITFTTQVDYTRDLTDKKTTTTNKTHPENIKRIIVNVNDGEGYETNMYFYAPNIGVSRPAYMDYR
ncbi:type II secretion system protein [Campylobacter ureolyticus]|uniref:type II secretion system protein n=1 Tax=Campylobacter ureolyticus TaxID=827 RepID=UPI00291406E5|nr:type II secretion system protein [Campylobacter ureolyticus]MDU7070184.1 type II secretion system protein [Campylobacter ureolyticus]